MNELFDFVDNLYNSIGVIGVIGLMWGIAFVLVPILQLFEYIHDCKKYGKEYADELHRRM